MVRYSCPLSTGVLQDLLCLKVYSWYILAGRCTPCLPTPLPSCSQLSMLVFTVMLSFSVTAYKLIHSSPYFSTLSWTYTVDSESEIIKIINLAANFLCGGLVTKFCLTLATPWIVACRLLCPGNSPGKNTGMDYYALLQGIFLTQDPGIEQESLMLPALAGRFFTTSAAWEAFLFTSHWPGYSLDFNSLISKASLQGRHYHYLYFHLRKLIQ